MKCPKEKCGKTFREEDVLTNSVFDSLHGRSIGNNWLSTIKCPHCKSDITVRQTIKLEVFGYEPKRRSSDKTEETG